MEALRRGLAYFLVGAAVTVFVRVDWSTPGGVARRPGRVGELVAAAYAGDGPAQAAALARIEGLGAVELGARPVFRTLTEILAEPRVQVELVPEGSPTPGRAACRSWSAPKGVGKSMLTLWTLQAFEGRCLYLDAEMSPAEIAIRAEALGWDSDTEKLTYVAWHDFTALPAALRRRALADVDLVVLDSAGRAMGESPTPPSAGRSSSQGHSPRF